MTEIKTHKSPWTKQIGGATRIEAPEFTHLASEDIHPHMARLTVEYVPREKTLDGDSVGEYFISFRDMRLTPEEAIHMVCDELVEACEPMMLNIASNYSPRAGMASSPSARYVHPDAQPAQQTRIINPNG